MATTYKLILMGDTPVNQIAERAFPVVGERPIGVAPRLAADLKDRYGFDVTVAAGRTGFLDLETDDGSFEYEPESYVRVVFRLDRLADPLWAVANILSAVRRVLDTGSEDAIFDFNGDILLFARWDGVLTKHRRGTWWERYSAGNQLIPD
ncbi:SitI3 family protein [Actinoplanes sp. TRM 88003]|uniref:SitI3 family protein n=1 Tax=Paractinoplanes aksuensis TaxID=2939490 RepID=A0ABT1DY59_9ACTN|nr:SitI3 family protein [Actinoplanes aksuensis]MCO8275825.1 SitI3 family protein [Actinoplanes aksuensis]